MIARFTGVTLGFLAFSIAIVAGLAVHNPVERTLTRALVALVMFFVLGSLLGGAARMVIAEYTRKCESRIDADLGEEPHDASEPAPSPGAPSPGADAPTV